MKKNFPLFIILNFLFLIFNSTSAQNPLVKIWDYRFGGTLGDFLYSLEKTTDGGFILGGVSSSNANGDKTQPQWGAGDYWIVKLDSLGNKQWDKDFGGIGNEVLYCVRQTIDNGFILGGISYSGISGDKTQPSWGNWDYWIVKTDSLGNMQWDKDFGGTDIDELHSVEQTIDHGYILGGFSKSGISGDKTEVNRDPGGNTTDYWIIKIDSLGNKEWDKDFGGVSNDNLLSIHQTNNGGFIFGGTSSSPAGADSLGNKEWDKDFGGTYPDYLSTLQRTSDNGYIVGGYSQSDISGDKSQPLWGGMYNDYWILKLDSVGNKEWDKDFGGTDYDFLYSISQAKDGGYIFGGHSYSNVSGDKTQPTWGLLDYWIVKTDAQGNKQWDKDFGGLDFEDYYYGNITLTTDGGYLFAGSSYSNISGDKTENNLGQEQTWIIKIDSLGNKQWDKTLRTNSGTADDESGLAIQTRDGCYAMANLTAGGIGGDKSQPAWNYSYDYWIIKFCEGPTINISASIQNLCSGTCTSFLNLSTNATSYQWIFPGAIPPSSTDAFPANICYNNPGSYDVTLIATNAYGTDTLTLINGITVYPAPAGQAIAQNGDTLTANTGAVTYQWFYNTNIINGATNYFYIAPASGDYNVVCTDSNGCEVEAVVFNVIASAQFEVLDLRFEVYPNPVEEKLYVKSYALNGAAAEITIYNMLGVLAAQPQTSNFKPETMLDVSALPSGIYYLEVAAGEKIFRSKFVKQ